MRRTLTAVASILLFLGSAGFVGAQETPEPLDKLLDHWEAAFNAGDYAAMAAVYTDDAIRMPPGEELIRGPAAIAERSNQFAGFKIELNSYSGLVDGDLGTSWGTYKLVGKIEGEPVTIEGRWMNAVKKTADGWKIYRDIWHEMSRM
ncbi:MAG: nuclear transport factor 2 family protein [Gemmatimonadetes bacterium]|nr:nuclear transport factor 2 family protein [Gemmatimonadota bacterium]